MSSVIEAAPPLEGVFGMKPAAITSAQVIRNVQHHFDPSELFKPWIEREQERKDAEGHNQKQKRRWRGRRATSVKMGHGGTLDPMATGVLVLGLGSGTKQLHYFSDQCTKSYDTVVLFGASTDTYDTDGKVVARKTFDHIKREDVEKALAKFRGKIMQKPPIYSALRVQGKRLYEYARQGKELPVKIQERPVEVQNLEILEWLDGGTHQWRWPTAEAEPTTKQVAEKLSSLDGDDEPDTNSIRKRAPEEIDDVAAPADSSSSKRHKSETYATESTNSAEAVDAREGGVLGHEVTDTTGKVTLADGAAIGRQKSEAQLQKDDERASDLEPCPAPACVLRMTVTSGFYVRSLCHDLGDAVGSLGTMASLVRTRQDDFELGTNVLQYDDLEKGEAVWGPRVKELLENWMARTVEKSG